MYLSPERIRAHPPLVLGPGADLARSRAHEVFGFARRFFALVAASRLEGPILWLMPRWYPERLMGDGICRFVEPGRIVFGNCRGALDILWAAEETLRSGLVPLVVAELPVLPNLTQVRRLHLAAGEGAERRAPPLMLMLTMGEGGVPGIETRWRMDPRPGWSIDRTPRWRLARTRARTAPMKSWDMQWQDGRPMLTPAAEEAA